MAQDIETLVRTTVIGLGLELVDIERSSNGLCRVFIDKVGGVGIEDCADVSNHLTRVFAVEGIDFDRLEVSSPGLDRPLKTAADFVRFKGHAAKVRLNDVVDGRKRFDGIVDAVDEGNVTFVLIEEHAARISSSKRTSKAKSGLSKAKFNEGAEARKLISVPMENIDRARLIPEI